MKERVSILGLGWLGAPLAKALHNSEKSLQLSTTSATKAAQWEQEGWTCHQLSLTPQLHGASWDQFLDTDVLIICIPPKVREKGGGYHPQQMAELLPRIKPHSRVIYTSSTGIFTAHAGQVVDESTLPMLTNERTQALGYAENTLKDGLGERLTILRLGGLMGYDRIPGAMGTTKPLRSPHQRVNFVHRDDAVGILASIIEQKAWGHTLHAVAPEPATREAVYAAAAAKGGWPLPLFDETITEKGHWVSGNRTRELLAYRYIFANPIYFKYHFPIS